MKYFPFFMELSKQSVLLIGGGEVAERKLDLLLKANAKLTIISPQFTDYILDLIKNNKNITAISSTYKTEHMDNNFSFVIAATNDESLNEEIASQANQKGILVNVVAAITKEKLSSIYSDL